MVSLQNLVQDDFLKTSSVLDMNSPQNNCMTEVCDAQSSFIVLFVLKKKGQ